MKNLLLFIFLIFNSCNAKEPAASKQLHPAQKKDPKDYPKNYFRNPLGIPIQLSANFGELRTNHFHMGWDIRTNQRENLPVYAAAEGYVSRISVEENGFGNAIYITHPNGFTTVYGHLNDFFPALSNFLKESQYASESWEQDIDFTPEKFPVGKGQFIAYSGNTGASGGPHLHFEIRDTETGNNLNPWLFNFNLPDNIPPSIYKLFYYDRRHSTYTTNPKAIAIKGSRGIYSTNGVVDLQSPQLSFGISAEDKSNTSPFSFGIYEAELWVDESMQSRFTLNDISYDSTRYLNASIDYKTRYSGGAYIQHLSLLPGNQITIFSAAAENGVLLITDTMVHNAEIIVKDAAGNQSTLEFQFKVNHLFPVAGIPENGNNIPLSPNRENSFRRDDLNVTFSSNAFYDTIPFVYKSEPTTDGRTISKIHYLHNYKVPVHDSFTVQISPINSIPDQLKDKVVLHMISNKKTEVQKGYWENAWLTARFREFGIFRLLLDTIPPVITPLGWKNGSKLRLVKSIAVVVRDNVSKVKTFKAYVDGQWLLFSRKNGVFTHKFDNRISAGIHELKIVAQDVAGNTVERTYNFTR